MHKAIQDVDIELLFTQGCHHRRLSVIFITQNICPRGSNSRTIALNTYYLVPMKNMRNASQITTLSRQLYPGPSRFMIDSYTDATKQTFGYIVVDTSPQGNDKYRLRTNIFPDEDPIVHTKNELSYLNSLTKMSSLVSNQKLF